MSPTMRSSLFFHVFLLVTSRIGVVSSCNPSPNTNPRTVVTATATSGTTCAAAKNLSNHNNKDNNNHNQIFGVPEAKLKAKVSPPTTTASLSSATTKQIIQELRGGELHEPETLEDTEALVLNAATNRKLLVIDFTASWW
jgi:hypothetical protein